MKILLISLFAFLCACGGNGNNSNSSSNLSFEKSGNLTIVEPGTNQINIDHLDETIPSDADVDFTIEIGQIVTPEGGIDILEESSQLTIAVEDDAIANDLGMEIAPISNGLSNSADIMQSAKMVIYVNDSRAVVLYKTETQVGALDRHLYQWALYSR